MITGGIVTKKYSSSKYRVRVPIFDLPGNPLSVEFDCYALSIPGQSDAYRVGDRVYLDFYENRAGQPIILGHQPSTADVKENVSTMNLNSLTVTNRTILPKDIMIGDISYNDLLNMKKMMKALEDRLITLEKK